MCILFPVNYQLYWQSQKIVTSTRSCNCSKYSHPTSSNYLLTSITQWPQQVKQLTLSHTKSKNHQTCSLPIVLVKIQPLSEQVSTANSNFSSEGVGLVLAMWVSNSVKLNRREKVRKIVFSYPKRQLSKPTRFLSHLSYTHYRQTNSQL